VSDRDESAEAPEDDPLWDTFEASFPLEAFAEVAQAVDLPEDPETLAWLRDLLLPEFRFFVESCPGEEFSHEERITRLEGLRDAAVTLDRSLGPGETLLRFPRRVWDSDLITDQFIDTLRILALEAGKQIQRLRSSRGQEGRRRKDAARQLGKDLLRVCQTIMRQRARDVDCDCFYRFAQAACGCLRASMRHLDRHLFQSPRQLRVEIREIWSSRVNKQNEKPLPRQNQ
jgi:hypothetical protein